MDLLNSTHWGLTHADDPHMIPTCRFSCHVFLDLGRFEARVSALQSSLLSSHLKTEGKASLNIAA